MNLFLNYKIIEMYEPGLTPLKKGVFILEKLILKNLPKLYRKLVKLIRKIENSNLNYSEFNGFLLCLVQCLNYNFVIK